MSDSIENIIAQDRQQAALDEQRRQQAIDEARPIARVREALEQLRTYGGPVDGSSETAVADWTARLVALRDALEEAGQLQLLDRLPANGNARQLLLTLLRQGRDNLAGRITEALTSVAPLGELARELLHELSCQLPQDLQGLLAEWNGPARSRDEDAKRPGARSSGPLYQDQAVLAFMVSWEHQLRTGASRNGQPEHYPLPEKGETANDRPALKLLRACCSDYFVAEKTVLAFFGLKPEAQAAIQKSMRAIVDRAREAAARDVLFDGSPPADEDIPTANTPAEADAPEGARDAIPLTSPLSAPDLARLLRDRGLDRATDEAVSAFL